MRNGDARKLATKAEVAITGKRWCSSCQMPRYVEGGALAKNRWNCAACIKRRDDHMRKRT